MAGRKRNLQVEALTAELLSGPAEPGCPGVSPIATLQQEIARLECLDYGRLLRKVIGRAEICQIVTEGKKQAWPQLNDAAVRLGSMKQFAQKAYQLGADFQIAQMSWPSGLALFGFYLGSGPGLPKRPLICVNGAHHRAAIGTAFSHEVGHHVIAKLFDSPKETIQVSGFAGYEAHLHDPTELGADIMVSLGIYPRATAEKLFEDAVDTRPARSSKPARIATALAYVGCRYGLEFENLPAQKKLQYHAGLIHFTKLRQALLCEYGI